MEQGTQLTKLRFELVKFGVYLLSREIRCQLNSHVQKRGYNKVSSRGDANDDCCSVRLLQVESCFEHFFDRYIEQYTHCLKSKKGRGKGDELVEKRVFILLC